MAKHDDDLSPAALPELSNRGETDSYERSDEDKKTYGDEKDDHHTSANVVISPADEDHLADVLAMEERIQKGTATKEVSRVVPALSTSFHPSGALICSSDRSAGIRHPKQPRRSGQGLVDLRRSQSSRHYLSIPLPRSRFLLLRSRPRSDLLLQASDHQRLPVVLVDHDLLYGRGHVQVLAFQGYLPTHQPRSLEHQGTRFHLDHV